MIATLPAFLVLKSEHEYREHFVTKYCSGDILTHDGFKVRFFKEKFEDAFFESSNRQTKNKDLFSLERAKRMDWIEYVLTSDISEIFVGWDRENKTLNKKRRVAIISPEDYVVVIDIIDIVNKKARFITAYHADNSAWKIRSAPKWQ